MGADVIKVESPAGDASRFRRGPGNQEPMHAWGPQFAAANRGKRSVALDVKWKPGRAAIERLIDGADVFVSNYREAALARMGLGYEALRQRNPRLIYAIATGFGPEGPDAGKAMVDGAGQARAGLVHVTGAPGGPRMLPGAALADTAGSMQLALGILTALAARDRHGMGQRVDVSSFGGQIWLQMWELTHQSLTGHRIAREGAHHPLVPGTYGTYETADGHSIFLGFPMTEPAWQSFCSFAGDPGLGTDERWNSLDKRTGGTGDPDGRIANELRPLIGRAFAGRTLDEWVSFLEREPDIVWERVREYADVLTDPQAEANGYIVEMDLPALGRRRVVGNPVRLSETPGRAKGPPPELGQHTEPVLRELGYAGAELAEILDYARRARQE
jgi:crotonobetainyl-CoA:carnitine CoA-transferase CaiB-like acyl-CoA transferase